MGHGMYNEDHLKSVNKWPTKLQSESMHMGFPYGAYDEPICTISWRHMYDMA